jgi:hypothetical protein
MEVGANGLAAGGDVEAPPPTTQAESPLHSKDNIVKVTHGVIECIVLNGSLPLRSSPLLAGGGRRPAA